MINTTVMAISIVHRKPSLAFANEGFNPYDNQFSRWHLNKL